MSVSDEFADWFAANSHRFSWSGGEEGRARIATYECEDGWLVNWTTTRVQGGEHDGKFVVQLFKPVGRGARSGRGGPSRWTETYRRAFAKRKTARARLDALYAQHSPKWAAKRGS